MSERPSTLLDCPGCGDGFRPWSPQCTCDDLTLRYRIGLVAIEQEARIARLESLVGELVRRGR